jgi:hypothetical protein
VLHRPIETARIIGNFPAGPGESPKFPPFRNPVSTGWAMREIVVILTAPHVIALDVPYPVNEKATSELSLDFDEEIAPPSLGRCKCVFRSVRTDRRSQNDIGVWLPPRQNVSRVSQKFREERMDRLPGRTVQNTPCREPT